MQEFEASNKVLNISEEVYHNLCDMRSASEIMRDFRYPTVRETCFYCLEKIDEQSPSMACAFCMQGCHWKCLEVLAQHHYEVRKKLTASSYECLSCIDFNRCMNCKNYLELTDIQIHTCSICLRKTHQRCHPLPLKVMESETKIKYSNMSEKQSVCLCCFTRFGIKNIISKLNYNQKEYYFVLVNHPSPIHFTWIQDCHINSKLKNEEELNILISSQPQIEAIFSMYIPAEFTLFTIDKIWQILRDNSFLCANVNMRDRFKFLIKWRHTYNSFIWVDMSIFQQSKLHLSKFFHQLKMNDIFSHRQLPQCIIKKYLASCISAYCLQNNIQSIKKPAGKEEKSGNITRTSGQGGLYEVENIHSIYTQKTKQYLNMKSVTVKAEAMCELINTIYFFDKNPAPIAIFTDESKVNWWVSNLIQRAPYLTILALQGPQQHTQEMVRKSIFKGPSGYFVSKFNVLIVAYQSLKVIGNMLDFKHMLQGYSLLIMDEKMSPLGKYYYSNINIARIKFHKESREEVSSSMNDRNQPTYSANSEQKRSSLTLSSSQTLKGSIYNPNGKKLYPKSQIKIFFEQFNERDLLDNIKNKQLSELERLLFLRVIINFGLTLSTTEDIYNKMMEKEPKCFSEPKEAVIPKLEEYIRFFMTHLYYSCTSKIKKQISEEIKLYFFFNIQPSSIFKIIIDLFRMKIFCKVFENDPNIQLKIPLPRITLEETVVLQNWTLRHNYLLCKAILYFGVGNWEVISESRGFWNKKNPLQSFRQYFCETLCVNLIGAKPFNDFLRIRAKEIASALQKFFT